MFGHVLRNACRCELSPQRSAAAFFERSWEMDVQSMNLQRKAPTPVEQTPAPPEKGAVGIALVVWLLGGGLGLAVLVFILLKLF
jgi:hypothetical protein